MVEGIHDPDANTKIEVRSHGIGEDRSEWAITAHLLNGQANRSGILTIYHPGYDGYDWSGDELNEDELQTVLDLFDGEYEGE